MPQKLLTAEVLSKLPALYANEGKGLDAPIVVKFFNPCGAATWYITEGSYEGEMFYNERTKQMEKDYRFFGLCDLFGDGGELGYVMFSELNNLRLRFGLWIERDIHFSGKTLRDVMK